MPGRRPIARPERFATQPLCSSVRASSFCTDSESKRYAGSLGKSPPARDPWPPIPWAGNGPWATSLPVGTLAAATDMAAIAIIAQFFFVFISITPVFGLPPPIQYTHRLATYDKTPPTCVSAPSLLLLPLPVCASLINHSGSRNDSRRAVFFRHQRFMTGSHCCESVRRSRTPEVVIF